MTLHELKLNFLGARDTVTGSRTLLSTHEQSFLIDCGLFQGTKEIRLRNWAKFPFNPEKISSVVLTHAHLDHSGYLPKLVREGFSGKIYCSPGTADLLSILLLDAAFLEEESARYANKSGYSNHKPALPLFTTKDAEAVFPLIEIVGRNDWVNLTPELSFRFFRAGHIIGASFIQFSYTDPYSKSSCLISFSGDLGHSRSQILRGPEDLMETDYLVLESTYGNRRHPRSDANKELAEIINRTTASHGVLLIPAFAVGRAQEVIYAIKQLEDSNSIKSIPVYLDSPMAQKATKIMINHPEDHILDSRFLQKDISEFYPEKFQSVSSVDESMSLCSRSGPMIVISASGMLSGGRILHHLKARLSNKNNTLLFTGYQAEGTKGRFLQDNFGKIESLRIHHQEIPIFCDIQTLDELSAHADYEDMLAWLARMKRKPKEIFINHGTENSQQAFAEKITEELGIKASPVYKQGVYNLSLKK